MTQPTDHDRAEAIASSDEWIEWDFGACPSGGSVITGLIRGKLSRMIREALSAAREEGQRCAKTELTGHPTDRDRQRVSLPLMRETGWNLVEVLASVVAAAREEGWQAGIRAAYAAIEEMPVVYNMQEAGLNVCAALLNSLPPVPTSPPAAPSPPDSK